MSVITEQAFRPLTNDEKLNYDNGLMSSSPDFILVQIVNI